MFGNDLVVLAQGFVDPEDWTFLLTGGLGDSGTIPNPAPDWLQERAWKELGRLAQMPGFKVYTTLCPATSVPSLSACFSCSCRATPGTSKSCVESTAATSSNTYEC